MPATKSLQDLFINPIKDKYYAEKQILKALPKMAKKADSDELRRAFEHHLKETEGQVGRLEQIFGLCGLKPSAKTCPAIKGITPTCSSPTSPRAGSIAKPHSCALRRPCLRMAVRAGSPALWLFAP